MAKRADANYGAERVYEQEQPKYERLGLYAVPIKPGQKKPAIPRWQHLGSASARAFQELRDQYGHCNIGLIAGTVLANGNLFGFIDVDDDGYLALVQTVIGSRCPAKKGVKGGTLFCQFPPDSKSAKLKPEGESKPIVELFVDSGQTVIPPSRHPSGCRYSWEDAALYDCDPTTLPFVDQAKIDVITSVVRNKNAFAIVEGGPDVSAHDLMLRLTSSGIAQLTDDLMWLADCLNALFHPAYAGNTKSETLDMLNSAKKKGLGARRGGHPYDSGEEGPIPLGYTRDGLFVIVDRERQIIIRASANQLLSGQYLLGIASSGFWARQFPSEKTAFNSYAAGEALIAACKKAGPIDPSKIRGRGIWQDGDIIVVNLGGEIPSGVTHVYLCFDPIVWTGADHFDTRRLLEHLQRFRWRQPQDATLLLGWFAIAAICGVLDWRPHGFIYGPPRCGKTTIHVLASHLLRPLVISADGQSSEAGIRQTVGPDSIAVIMDEFETDQSGQSLRAVLRLARSASSANNVVLRGTPEGKAMQFSLRTCFLFSAVNPGRMSPADQSRILLLEMQAHDGSSEAARKIAEEEAYFRGLGPQWCGFMVKHAHLVGPAIDALEPEILSTDRRHRQNIATLLAGAFIALHGRAPSKDEARVLAEEHSALVEHHGEDIDRDNASECLQKLFSYVFEHYPLGHWMGLALSGEFEDDRQEKNVERVMRIFDMKSSTDPDGILVRHGSPAIDDLFRETIWEGMGWQRALRSLDGAFRPKNPVYFGGAAGKHRCVGIPAELIPEPLESPQNQSSEGEF